VVEKIFFSFFKKKKMKEALEIGRRITSILKKFESRDTLEKGKNELNEFITEEITSDEKLGILTKRLLQDIEDSINKTVFIRQEYIKIFEIISTIFGTDLCKHITKLPDVFSSLLSEKSENTFQHTIGNTLANVVRNTNPRNGLKGLLSQISNNSSTFSSKSNYADQFFKPFFSIVRKPVIFFKINLFDNFKN
jgi:hypothetical protein